ncbi:serine/arginine repetitive matrix protein 2-like isoform X2 [Amphibalanus amphitrite]|uniref:serine/arginine repetitive matrix protein 2-like isoform X2 n=1 Tax=Amphibalanus amphitrite TaxID=1232801 RepID=UPI001C90DCF4|nr:serine/arginine repetitive matrix protein 2-like isoform X2 [Amphibalanus amphitrite]
MRGFLHEAARILRKPSKRGSQDLQQPCEVVDDEVAEPVTEVSPSRRRPPQRRESTKLQSATKFLRALRAGKGDVAGDGASPPDRSNPHYHSEGKANRRRAKQAKARAEQTERSHSFHDKVSKRSVASDDARRRDSLDSDALPTDLSGDPPPTYENVVNGSGGGGGGVITASGSGGRDEPGRPLQRDKERRSARKLTKDSGYETSPYSEADYASLSLRSESAETLTERRAEPPGRPALQQYLTEEYLIGVDTSRLGGEPARRASVSEASEPGSVHSGSTLVPERSGDDGRSSSSSGGGGRVRSPPVGAPRSDLALACSQSTPSLAQHALTPGVGMVYNYAADAAPAGWDEERERQAYAAHLRSSSYQLHSRQRSALTGGSSEAALHARQPSGHSAHSGDDDTHSHASFHSTHSLYGKEAARAAAVSAGVGIGVPAYPTDGRRASHDALPIEPPPPPPPPPPMSDAASDVTSLHDGESLTYDLDDIDRALASDVPERDPASLTHIRYGPGHEKYPSWPVPAAAEPESGPLSGGSFRSKSWTDNSELPKDRAPAGGYTRPHAKKSFSATFQQQLNTVMEKCERIGPESFLAPAERESRVVERDKSESPRDDKFPVIDRDGRGPGDKDYNIPSPPERDYDDKFCRPEPTFSEELGGPRGLSTPFLDQLRRDIVMSPVEDGDGGEGAEQSWSGERTEAESQPRSGRDSVATVVTYSSSNSSNEPMRLYGSFSDISVVSSATSRSDPHPDHQIAHSSRVKPPQRLLSENVTTAPPPVRHRPEFKLAKSVDETLITGRESDAPDGGRDSRDSLGARDSRERNSPKSSRSPAIDYSKPPSVTDRIKALESQSRESRRDLHSKSVPNLLADKWSWRGAGRLDADASLPTADEGRGGATRSGRSLDQTPSDRARPADARTRGTDRRPPARSVSSDRCRAALPAETERRRSSQPGPQKPQHLSQLSQPSQPSQQPAAQKSSQHSQQQPQQHDSSTLKAIQKQAVMSYYERHMSRAAAPQTQADPKVPEKHERGYRAGPTLWRVPESLQPDSAAAARPARGSPPSAGRSRGPSRRSSSASDRTTASSSTSSSHSSGRSSSSSTSHLSGLGHSRGSSHGSIGEQSLVHARKITELPGSDSVCSSLPAVPTVDGDHSSIRASKASQHVRSSSRDDQPPERPPKKPHLRALSSGALPPPPADEPPSSPPSRPPKSPCIRKPALPEPARSGSPDLPPPPPPPVDESLTISDEPLPPPPPSMLEVQVAPHGGATGAVRSPSSAQRAPPLSPSGQPATYHKDSYMAHRRDWKFGYEGRYRRTMSPSPPARAAEPSSPSPPPPPPPVAPTPAIGRSVSYAAPRCEEATTPRLEAATSAGRLTEGGSKVARQPSTTVVFTDAELRAFRAREQRSKELRAAEDSGEDKENVREQNGAVVEPVSHPRRQYSLELLGRPAAPAPAPTPAAATPVSQESPPPPLQPAPTAYRSPIAEARNERFAAYKKYSEIKSSGKAPAAPPAETAVPALVTDSFPESERTELPEPAAAPAGSSSRSVEPVETARLNGEPARPSSPSARHSSPPQSPPRPPRSQPPAQIGRRKLPEEIECEQLSRAFVSQAPVDNKLQNLLVPGPDHRTSAHYIQGLFDLQLTRTAPRKAAPACAASAAPARSPAGSPDKPSPETSPLRPDSAYFTTSASKAKFLTQYGRDVSADQSLKNVHNVEEVKRQKEELAARISRKLDILRAEQQAVRQEIETNVTLGAAVWARVEQLAQPAEADKYSTYVEQIGTITSLLLGLSGRLARAENALGSLGEQDVDERANLTSKRDKLSEQLEEARKLKLNIDRRSQQVNVFLQHYLSSDEYADYQHFIQMKAKLIMDSREIDDKLRLGEEQLAALSQT